MADDLATSDAAAKHRATQAALEEVLAGRDRERAEATQRVEQAEQLSEARLLALKQYVAHHSSCSECYKVWTDVTAALEADRA